MRVDLLCRFRTPACAEKTLQDLKKGQVDCDRYSQSSFSRMWEYKNLGLLIVDEEQRFSVTHKGENQAAEKILDVSDF